MLWVWTNPPEQAEIIEQENQQTEIEVKSKDKENINENFSIEDINNDLFDDIYKDNSDYVTEIKNNLFDIKFSKKGGQISHLALNKFIDYNKLCVWFYVIFLTILITVIHNIKNADQS